MPGILSGIPGLANLPNPLNIFNSDDAPPSSPSATRQQQQQDPMASNNNAEAGPSKFMTMLSKGFDTLTMSNPTTPVKSTADGEEGSPTPMRPAMRCETLDGNERPSPSKTGVVIADSATELDGPRTQTQLEGRKRGLSSASRGSGGIPGVSDPRRRNRRVETFVLVKPPPTSSKNPLNLQVQLVVPARSGRPRGGSDAAQKAVIPPVPAGGSQVATTTAMEDSSVPSTPARQSFDTPVEKVTSSASETSTSNPSMTSEPPQMPDAPPSTLATLPEGEAGTKLRRRSSTGSQTSVGAASSISSSSGKQRIIPLYNLAVHNVVQPTIVTDAGTDSRVAKFLKRSLDISGVGILEPSEVWLPPQNGSSLMLSGSSPRPSLDPGTGARMPRPASMISNMSLLSPAVTRDLSQDGKKPTVVEVKPIKEEKKFFGKIFRKRGSADPLSATSDRRASVSGRPPDLKLPATPPNPPTVHFPVESSQVGHPTFGLAPAVLARSSSQTNLDLNGAIVGLMGDVPKPDGLESEELRMARSARPVGYTWTVRRWAKKNTEGWAAHIVAAAAAGLDMVANAIPGDGSDEVVFEWVKMRLTPSSEGAVAALRRHPALEGADLTKKRLAVKATPSPSPLDSPAGSKVSLVTPAHLEPPLSATLKRNRAGTTNGPSPASSHKATPPRTSPPARSSDEVSSLPDSPDDHDQLEVPALNEPNDDDEDGYDSDPEDSETPWSCSVWVKRTGQRQLLATLTPAPHHPKVIGVLKIPTQLRGVGLTDIPVAPSAPGASADLAARVREEVCLTEENLKDVVSVTAMWLVAREEFSGFGRKDKRRG